MELNMSVNARKAVADFATTTTTTTTAATAAAHITNRAHVRDLPGADLYATVKAMRSAEYNRRIATHEVGHAYAARALGSVVEYVTVVPDDKFAGQCVRRGAPSRSLNLLDESKLAAPTAPTTTTTTADIVAVCAHIGAPEIGTPRVDLAEAITRAQTHIIELLAGSCCERIMYPDLPPLPAEHDLTEARALASVIAAPQAVPALLAYCTAEAESLIRAHLGVVAALVDALAEKGTLIGSEVDKIISDAVAAEVLATEHARRREQDQRAENSSKFLELIAPRPSWYRGK
jgi:hypothetical protein